MSYSSRRLPPTYNPGRDDESIHNYSSTTSVDAPPSHPSALHRRGALNAGDDRGSMAASSTSNSGTPLQRPALPPRPDQSRTPISSPQPMDAPPTLLNAPSPFDSGPPTPNVNVELDSTSPTSPTSTLALDEVPEENLTEAELRTLYDEEELDRFLNLFSAYVHEVRLAEPKVPNLPTGSHANPLRASSIDEQKMLENAVEEAGGNWTVVDHEVSPTSPVSKTQIEGPLSQRIAMRIVPLLPPAGAAPPQFTLNRLKEVAQRLFLALEPSYRPFVLRMIRLSTWQDWNTSCIWCCVYWALWLTDMVLPSIILRVIWSLVRRRLFTYPTLKELRERREEIIRSEEFGGTLAARLTKTSRFGVKDAWKIFRDFRTLSDMNIGSEKEKGKEAVGPPDDENSDIPVTPSDQELLKFALKFLNAFADVHERARNIFLWRKPDASKRYGIILAVLFLATLVTPAKYLARMVYFGAGFGFWFVIPIIAALPSADRRRFPQPFFDVPTDTDYAMQLMSDRVAKGQILKPSARRHKLRKTHASNEKINVLGAVGKSGDEPNDGESPPTWIQNAKKVAKTSQTIAQEGYTIAKKIRATARGEDALTMAAEDRKSDEESFTFFAQHTTGPGLISLSATSLRFVLAAGGKKLAVPRASIRGVKKTDALAVKGLAVRWTDENGYERVEKFLWVKNRDDAFARLVSGGQQQWLRI